MEHVFRLAPESGPPIWASMSTRRALTLKFAISPAQFYFSPHVAAYLAGEGPNRVIRSGSEGTWISYVRVETGTQYFAVGERLKETPIPKELPIALEDHHRGCLAIHEIVVRFQVPFLSEDMLVLAVKMPVLE